MKSDFKRIPRSLTSNVPLAPLTTLRIGGSARYFVEAETTEEVKDVLTFARANSLPVFALGGGSNILVPDGGVYGMVLKMSMRGINLESDAGDTLLIADAGVRWDDAVDFACANEIFGIENLAGIPGTVGGAVVQNIGAYGAELANVFEYADVINKETGEASQVALREAEFKYRDSFFKKHRELVITQAVLRFKKGLTANISYPDLALARASGVQLFAPAEIAGAVRAIRAKKFPAYLQAGLDIAEEGTAGSFFKNPIVSRELADSLAKRFDGLPTFPNKDGTAKISLAWILDKVLCLNGFSVGRARLYEKQPLVIVAGFGATAEDVNALAFEVTEKVFKKIGIKIEREVETFGN